MTAEQIRQMKANHKSTLLEKNHLIRLLKLENLRLMTKVVILQDEMLEKDILNYTQKGVENSEMLLEKW